MSIINHTNGKPFVIHYKKKDKTVRRISGRLSVLKGNNQENFAVLDNENGGVRHLLVAGVIAVIFERKCYYVVEDKQVDLQVD